MQRRLVRKRRVWNGHECVRKQRQLRLVLGRGNMLRKRVLLSADPLRLRRPATMRGLAAVVDWAAHADASHGAPAELPNRGFSGPVDVATQSRHP